MTGHSPGVPDVTDIANGWFWQPALAGYGAALLALVPFGAVWAWQDPRTVEGEPVAFKPTRFALSISVYMLTAAAMFEYVRPERRSTMLPQASVWMMIAGSTVELACITYQATRARRSHFNSSTPADAAIYATMGMFAVLFIGAVFPLALEIACWPDGQADRTMVQAIVAGLLVTGLVGGGTGGLMSAKGRRTIGRHGRGLPLLGWSMSGGDLRVPHFLGIHAMQALPFFAAAARAFSPPQALNLFGLGATAYVLLTMGLLHRALNAEPATRNR